MAMESDGRSRRRPKEQTRQAILDEARRMLLEQGTSERIDLRLSTVLERMDLTSGAAYNIWTNQDEFQRDLAMELARNYEWAGPRPTELSIDLDADDPTDELRRLADRYFDAFTGADEFFMTLRFWGTKQPSEELVNAIREGYELNRTAWTEVYQAGLEWSGRRMRPPFTIDDLVVALAAVVEGCALRHRFEPESVEVGGERHLHSEMVVAVLRHFTEEDGGH